MNDSFGTPLFSVVIPVYNKEPHVSRALNSVLKQSFSSYEIIVVCDPSTDNSNSQVEKFTDPRMRIHYRNKPGPGGYAARNLGITEAQGEWIAFLDADDEWLPDHLEKLVQTVHRYEQAQFISCGWMVSELGNLQRDTFSLYNHSDYFFTLEDYLDWDIKDKSPVWTSVVAVKKELIVKAGMFPDGKISMGGDVDTWLRCIALARGGAWSNHIGAIYYRDSVNMVTKGSVINPSLHVETVNSLSVSCNAVLAGKFKKRANKYIIYAWNNNVRVCSEKNFKISEYIFLSADIARGAAYLLFDLLPLRMKVKVHNFISYYLISYRNAKK